jgi:hypothetical protein
VCFTPGGQQWVAPGGSQQWRGGLASSVPRPVRHTRPLRRSSTRRPPSLLLHQPSSSNLGTRPSSLRLCSRCRSRHPLPGSWTPAPPPHDVVGWYTASPYSHLYFLYFSRQWH